MDFVNVPYYDFLIFIVPGFVGVFILYKAAGKNFVSGLKLLVFVFLFGLVTLIILELLPTKHPGDTAKLLANPYASVVVLSIIAFDLGGLIGFTVEYFIKKVEKLEQRDKFRKELLKK